MARQENFYNGFIVKPSNNVEKGDPMSTTLHNKIYLGRNTMFGSRRMQAALALGVLTGLSLVWATMRAMR